MSSSDEEDVFNVKTLLRKQKKKRASTLTKGVVKCESSQPEQCDFDNLLDVQFLTSKPSKCISDDSDLSDPDAEDIPALERIKMKRERREARLAERERELRGDRPPETVLIVESDDSSGEAEQYAGVRTRSCRARRARRSASNSPASSDCEYTTPPPAKKKPSPSVELEKLKCVEIESDPELEVLDVDDADTIEEVRYLVKDFGGVALATFFYPSGAKVVEIEERFRNKLDQSLPYLYFFTDDMQPIDPEKTPAELGWNLRSLLVVRVLQSSQISFHLAAKKKAEEEATAAAIAGEDIEDGRILVKFQMRDKKPLKVLIDPGDKFSKIKEEFCKAHDVDAEKCFLIFDNERLGDEETPNDYDMERNDCIDVHA